MKKLLIISLFSLLPLLFFLSGCQGGNQEKSSKESEIVYSNEVQVVLILGQSNAEGHTHSKYIINTMGEEKEKLYKSGFNNVEISYANTITANTSNGKFVPVSLGQGTGLDRFGPEIGIAERISAIDPEKRVMIIKYAYGGTTLNNEWRSPSSKNPGRLYTGAVEYILNQCEVLEEMDLYPIIKAVCWMQGESDASGLSYNNYKELEEKFVKDLRSDLAYYKPAESEIGFIDAGISECIAWTHYQEINNAKMELSKNDINHDYIDTIAAGLKFNAEPAGAPDIYHYDSKSMVELGYLFADVLLARYLEI